MSQKIKVDTQCQPSVSMLTPHTHIHTLSHSHNVHTQSHAHTHTHIQKEFQCRGKYYRMDRDNLGQEKITFRKYTLFPHRFSPFLISYIVF